MVSALVDWENCSNHLHKHNISVDLGDGNLIHI